MGFWQNLKELSAWSKKNKQKKEEKAKKVNDNPTEEELKNNKKGKLSYLWSVLSVITYLVAFAIVFNAFSENIALGFVALIFALPISPIVQRKAISLAQEQRLINGKGFFALLIATLVPTIFLAGGACFFIFGWYNFLF